MPGNTAAKMPSGYGGGHDHGRRLSAQDQPLLHSVLARRSEVIDAKAALGNKRTDLKIIIVGVARKCGQIAAKAVQALIGLAPARWLGSAGSCLGVASEQGENQGTGITRRERYDAR